MTSTQESTKRFKIQNSKFLHTLQACTHKNNLTHPLSLETTVNAYENKRNFPRKIQILNLRLQLHPPVYYTVLNDN